MIRWSPIKLKFTLGIGTIGSIVILSDLWQKAIPVWAAVGITILPIIVFIFADPDDVPHSIARFLQIGASLWYLALNSLLVAVFVVKHRIDGGVLLMFAFLAIGCIPCLIVLGRAFIPEPIEEPGHFTEPTWNNDVGVPSNETTASDFSQPVVYRPRKRKQLLLLLTSSIFVAGGLLMIHDGQAFGWLAVAFFGLGMVVFTLQLFPNCSYLRVSASGIEIRSLWRTHRYEWSDMSHFCAGIIGHNKMVLFNFSSSYHQAHAVRAVAKTLTGAEAALPDTYGFTAEALAEHLNQWMVSEMVKQLPLPEEPTKGMP